MTIISSALNAGRQTSWIANAYFITSTSFQLLYGQLTDVWSRKLVLLAGLLIFFLGSLAASLAQDAMQLIAIRALTGIGGGGLATIAQIIVSRFTNGIRHQISPVLVINFGHLQASDVVTLRERGKYQGILVGSRIPIADIGIVVMLMPIRG